MSRAIIKHTRSYKPANLTALIEYLRIESKVILVYCPFDNASQREGVEKHFVNFDTEDMVLGKMIGTIHWNPGRIHIYRDDNIIYHKEYFQLRSCRCYYD